MDHASVSPLAVDGWKEGQSEPLKDWLQSVPGVALKRGNLSNQPQVKEPPARVPTAVSEVT
jgi:hypothetical protein